VVSLVETARVEKAASTLFAASIVKAQLGLAPLHAPLQPAKRLPLAGVALNASVAPLARRAEQMPESVPLALAQSMLPVGSASLPEPLPAALIDS
jgi:hypothetical protein